MQTTVAVAPHSTSSSSTRQLAYATLATLLLAGILFEVITRATGYWELAAFSFGPDLALVYGVGANLEKGRLHPRAVGLYNLLHRYWLPLGLIAIASFDLVPLGFFVGGLAWCFHISLDRAIGYGLRTPDGFQRS
jgi:hypothetical protein